MAPNLDCYTTAGNDLLTCTLDDMVAAFGGEALFGVIVGAVIILASYWANDGRVGVPGVIIVISAGLLVSLLPSPYGGIARAFAFMALVAAIFAVLQRYFLEEPI